MVLSIFDFGRGLKRKTTMPGGLFSWILILLTLAALGCQGADPPGEAVRPVKTMVVPEVSQSLTRTFPGKIRPVREVNLSFRVSSQIKRFPVRKGQYVGKGEIIAALDPRDFEIAVRNISGSLDEARANLTAMLAGARIEDVRSLESRLEAARTVLDEATLQYERYHELYKTDVVPASVVDNARSKKDEARSAVRSLEMELEKALSGARQEDIKAMKARIESLEAHLDQARSALQDSVLRAPFDGYVSEKYADNHQVVSAGQPIVLFQDVSRLEISFGLPEQLMIKKDMIQSIHVRLEAFPQYPYPARIKEVTTDAAAATMTYILTVVFDRPWNVEVYPSMAADVQVAFGSEEGAGFLVVPETALVSGDGQHSMVWIFDPESQLVNSRKVDTARFSGQGVQIVHGLEPGEIIVRAGADFLEDGQKVRPINNRQ